MRKTESNPYVGPRPFERNEEDSKRFFGRSLEAQEIVSLIFGHAITLVYAQSGAGKTSLFNTAITSRLEENRFDVLPLTRVGGVVPEGIDEEDIRNLYIFNTLLKLDPNSKPEEDKNLLTKTLPEFLGQLRPAKETEDPRPCAIVFDQFEELFTYTPKKWRVQRDDFFTQVVEALNADPLLRVVFVIREDFLAQLDPYARDLPERLRIRYRLERLGEEAALQAIKEPLKGTGCSFAEGVAEKLIEGLLATRTVDATGSTVTITGQYVEPVQLQVVCAQLWDSLAPDVTEIQEMDIKDFDVNSALSEFYKSAIEATVKEKEISGGEAKLRNWFENTLITPMGTRSTTFRGKESTDGIPNDAVDYLESRHIIRAEYRGGIRWYELTHDRFIEAIQKDNKEWSSKNTTSLLQQQAALWKLKDRSESLLLRDEALEKAEQEALSLDLTPDEQIFLEKCRDLKRSNERERTFRLALLIAFIVAVAAFMVAGFSLRSTTQALKKVQESEAKAQVSAQQAEAEKQRANVALEAAEDAKTAAEVAQKAAVIAKNAAEEEKKRAEEQANNALAGSLAAQADAIKNSNHALSLLMGMEAYERNEDSLLTRSNLFHLIQFSPYTRLFGFAGPVTSMAVSPQGDLIAISSCKEEENKQCRNGAIKLFEFDKETKQPKLRGEVPSGSFGIVYSLLFSQDGKVLIAGGCVPSNGRYEGCADDKGQITFWDIKEPSNPLLLSNTLDLTLSLIHTGLVKTIALTPDNHYLASGSYDKSIIVWNVEDMAHPRTIGSALRIHSSFVNSLVFAPVENRNILVSASDDQTIQVYELTDPLMPNQLGSAPSGHTASVNSIAFSPDGKWLASAGDDNKVILWDWDNDNFTLQRHQVLEGHSGYVKSVAFASINDETWLASAGFDGRVLLWNVGAEETRQNGLPLVVHSGVINGVVFGALKDAGGKDQPYLLSGSSDRTIAKWDLATRRALSVPVKIPVTEPMKKDTAGNLEAVIDLNSVRIFLSNNNPDIPDKILEQHTGVVNSVAFAPKSPDGTYLLASASDDQTVILWKISDDLSNAEPFLILDGFESPIVNAYFVEDGRKLITVDKNGHTVEWNIDPSAWVNPLSCDAVNANLTSDLWRAFLSYLNGQTPTETCVIQP